MHGHDRLVDRDKVRWVLPDQRGKEKLLHGFNCLLGAATWQRAPGHSRCGIRTDELKHGSQWQCWKLQNLSGNATKGGKNINLKSDCCIGSQNFEGFKLFNAWRETVHGKET